MENIVLNSFLHYQWGIKVEKTECLNLYYRQFSPPFSSAKQPEVIYSESPSYTFVLTVRLMPLGFFLLHDPNEVNTIMFWRMCWSILTVFYNSHLLLNSFAEITKVSFLFASIMDGRVILRSSGFRRADQRLNPIPPLWRRICLSKVARCCWIWSLDLCNYGSRIVNFVFVVGNKNFY